MIETSGDKTIIRPTPKKWYTGAAIFVALGLFAPKAAWFLLPIAFLFAGMASGNIARLELSPRGLKSKTLFGKKFYRWSDVEDFKITKIRTSLFSSTKMLTFTRKDKRDTFGGKMSRFFGGGTESIPMVGISPEEMMACIGGYQAREHMFGETAKGQSDFRPMSAPVKPAPKSENDNPVSIGFGRPDTAPKATTPKAAAPKPAAQPATQPQPSPAARPVTFGKAAPRPMTNPIPKKRPSADPLVQEGGLFRKRRDASGL